MLRTVRLRGEEESCGRWGQQGQFHMKVIDIDLAYAAF